MRALSSMKRAVCTAALLVLFGCLVHASNPLGIDFDPAPPPEKGPPLSRNALRNKKYLPAEIGGIVGAYFLTLAVLGLLWLLVGRPSRHRAAILTFGDLEMVSNLPKSPKENKFWDFKKPWHSSGVTSPVKESKPWDFRKPWSNPTSPMKENHSPVSPGSGSEGTFDSQVIEEDKKRRAEDMERLYAAVMAHDETRSKTSLNEHDRKSPIPSPGLPSPSPTSPGLASPGLASPGLASPGLASPMSPGLASPMSPGLASPMSPGLASPMSPGLMSPGLTSAGLSSPGFPSPGLSSPGLSSPGLPSPGPPSPNLPRVSSPLASPRGAPTPRSPSITSKHSRAGSVNSSGSKRRGVRGLPISNPIHIPSYSQFMGGPASTRSNLSGRTGSINSPMSAGRQSDEEPLTPHNHEDPAGQNRIDEESQSYPSLPLREHVSSDRTKITVLERARARAPKTPRTGVPMTPMTPYSPYMPFTPITPVSPRLVTKAERKVREKEQARIVKEMTKSDKELFGSAY
ncbi:hypothetical protein FGG08_005937 [Glutinoglossum americanum]|uniref:Transmembrane protein n=1 Tax=Glutinoglossum americanum TaxID=1670608 RepID=A0A9P8I292_9PEZI|nr:hypothetical protein FGG08_005937 [Glutinoglossum americanum]